MSVSVQLSNLGPLRSAELEVADLTLLIGENNTGKTFLATVLHRVLDTRSESPFWRHGRGPELPTEVEEWISKVLDNPDDDLGPEFDWTPSKSTLTWARSLTEEVLQAYGAGVRDSIAYAFGAAPSLLRRRTRSRRATDCFLRITNSRPGWELEIRFDSDDITVESPDPEEWIRSVLRPDHIRDSLGRFAPARSRSRQFVRDILGFYPGGFSTSAQSGIFASWPSNAVHFPADRTGIMQSHNVLAGAAVRQSARAGIRPIEIETLPGTSADFLSLILAIPENLPYYERRKSRLGSLVKRFEDVMRAEIAVDQRSDGLHAIVAVTAEGRFPMARSSSMLSELAPLLLVLKSPGLYVDHLTIDEPEAHLHPEMQVLVASFLAELVNHGMRIVLTTHSDFFVAQFNNMIRLHALTETTDTAQRLNMPALDRSRVRAVRFSRENGWCVARELMPDPIDGVDESTFTDIMRSQYDDTAVLVNKLLESS